MMKKSKILSLILVLFLCIPTFSLGEDVEVAPNPDADYIWGLYKGVKKFEKNGKFGLMNEDNIVMVPAEYEVLNTLSKKYFIVGKKDEDEDEFRYFYRETLEEMIPVSGKQQGVDNFLYGNIPLLDLKRAEPLGVYFYSPVRRKNCYFDESGLVFEEEDLKDFSMLEGKLKAVEVDGKWGYMNMQGEMVIPPTWDWAGDFEGSDWVEVGRGEGTLMVREDLREYEIPDEAVYINKQGEEVLLIPNEGKGYGGSRFFMGVSRWYREEKTALMNEKGEVFTPYYDGIYPFDLNGLAVVIDNDGLNATAEEYERAGGHFPYVAEGVINTKGEIIVEPVWYKITFFACEEVNPQCENCDPTRHGLIKAERLDRTIFYTLQGEEFFTCMVSSRFSEGLASVYTEEGEGILDGEGRVIPLLRGEKILTAGPPKEGMIIAQGENYLHGAISTQGQWAVEPTWKYIGSNGYYKYGHLVVGEYREYKEKDDQGNLTGDTASVVRYGVINKEGELVVPVKYEYVDPDDEWFFLREVDPFTKEEKTWWVNLEGETIEGEKCKNVFEILE